MKLKRPPSYLLSILIKKNHPAFSEAGVGDRTTVEMSGGRRGMKCEENIARMQ